MTEEQLKLRNKLRRTEHEFHYDAGHGWLKVSIKDIIILGIRNDISGYSYKDRDYAYLEEDRDAGIYLSKLFPEGFFSEAFKQFDIYIKEISDGDYSPIRSYLNYM